jgi:hypothetical protein
MMKDEVLVAVNVKSFDAFYRKGHQWSVSLDTDSFEILPSERDRGFVGDKVSNSLATNQRNVRSSLQVVRPHKTKRE